MTDRASRHRSRTTAAWLVVAALCSMAALLAGAAAAHADGSAPAYRGSVLHVSTTGPLAANKTLTIVASGQNAPDNLSIHISYSLDVFAVDLSRLQGPCDTSENAELTDVTNTNGGRLLTFEALNEGPFGPFTIPLRFTPGGPGHLQICAYSVYVTDDAAWASTDVQIAPAGASGCTVPKLAGDTLAAARRALRRAGCRLGTVSRRRARRTLRGRVIATTPRAGKRPRTGSKVAVVLGR